MRILRKIATVVAAVAVPVLGAIETGVLAVPSVAASIVTGITVVATALAPSPLGRKKKTETGSAPGA